MTTSSKSSKGRETRSTPCSGGWGRPDELFIGGVASKTIRQCPKGLLGWTSDSPPLDVHNVVTVQTRQNAQSCVSVARSQPRRLKDSPQPRGWFPWPTPYRREGHAKFACVSAQTLHGYAQFSGSVRLRETSFGQPLKPCFRYRRIARPEGQPELARKLVDPLP